MHPTRKTLPSGKGPRNQRAGFSDWLVQFLLNQLHQLWIFLCDLPHLAIEPFIWFAEFKPRRDRDVETFSASADNNYWTERLNDKVIVRVPIRDANASTKRLILGVAGILAFVCAILAFGYGTKADWYHEYHQIFKTTSHEGYLQAMVALKWVGVALGFASTPLIYLAVTSRAWFFDSIKAEHLKDANGDLMPYNYTITTHWRKIHWKCGGVQLSPHIQAAKADKRYGRGRYSGRNDLYLLDTSKDVAKILKAVPEKDLRDLEELLNRLIQLVRGYEYELSQQQLEHFPARPPVVKGEVVRDKRRGRAKKGRSGAKRNAHRRWLS